MDALEKQSYSSQIRQLRILAEAALTHYPLGNARLALLSSHNAVLFKVTTARKPAHLPPSDADGAGGTRFVLRLYQQHEPDTEMVLSQLEWLCALSHDVGLGVPEPILTRTGSYVTKVEVAGIPEVRRAVLMRWVEGRFVDTKLTPNLMERVGMFLARLHQHAEHFTPSTHFVRPSWDWRGWRYVADHCNDLLPDHARSLLAASAEKVAAEIAALPKDAANFGLTHGAFMQNHYLFHRGEVRAINFEHCAWNHYLFDLATALEGIAGRPDEAAMHAALLNGYKQIRPFSRDHEEWLPVFTAASLLSSLNSLLSSSSPPPPAELSPYLEYALNNLCKFVDSKIKM